MLSTETPMPQEENDVAFYSAMYCSPWESRVGSSAPSSILSRTPHPGPRNHPHSHRTLSIRYCDKYSLIFSGSLTLGLCWSPEEATAAPGAPVPDAYVSIVGKISTGVGSTPTTRLSGVQRSSLGSDAAKRNEVVESGLTVLERILIGHWNTARTAGILSQTVMYEQLKGVRARPHLQRCWQQLPGDVS